MTQTTTGTAGDDHLAGASGDANVMAGNSGNDVLQGGSRGDVMYGGHAPTETWTGRITPQKGHGDYQNTLGVYEIDASGQIHNVRIVLANAADPEAIGRGIDVTVQNDNRLGFFILPDGYHYNSGLFEWVNDAGIASHFELRNGDGSTPGNGNVEDGPLTLFWVEHEHGWTEALRGADGNATYHNGTDLNLDGYDHIRQTREPDGSSTLYFEDMWNGGDESFTDTILTFQEVTKPAAHKSNDDVMHGGGGDDLMFGGNGNDVLAGEEGNDGVYGGSGNDLLLAAGGGNDSFDGGSGFDTLSYAGVADMVQVDLGKGWVQTLDGEGNILTSSTLKSVEGFVGGDAADRVTGSSNGDVLAGGAGSDWLRGKQGADTLTGGAGRDTFAWTKSDVVGGAVDRVTDFAVGVDRLDLADFLPGKGLKGTPWAEHVRLADGAQGTMVQAKVAGSWQDVVVLEGVHTTHLADLGL